MGLPKRRLQAWKGFDKNKSVSGHSEHLRKMQLFREWMSQQFKMAGDKDVILWTAELVLDFCFWRQTFFVFVVFWKWIDLLFCVPCKQKTKLVEGYTENRFLSWFEMWDLFWQIIHCKFQPTSMLHHEGTMTFSVLYEVQNLQILLYFWSSRVLLFSKQFFYCTTFFDTTLTSLAVTNMFHGIRVPIPWSIKVR